MNGLYLSMLITGMSLNVLEMAILIRENKIKDPFKMILFSLAVADFCLLFIVLTLMIYWFATGTVLVQMYYLIFFGLLVSQVHIVIITLQRWLAVTFPLQLRTLVTSRRCFLCLASVWIVSASSSLVYFILSLKSGRVVIAVILLVSGVFLLLSYSFIVTRVIKERRKTASSRSSPPQSHIILVYCMSVTLTFVVCNYPYAFHMILNDGQTSGERLDVNEFTFLLLFNCLLDPVIYFIIHAVRNKNLTCSCCLHCKVSREQAGNNHQMVEFNDSNFTSNYEAKSQYL